jgi:L,D-peptidoglycan transpeptidase YkuD (ErfK/YbiS/YcfS/YnhG family)
MGFLFDRTIELSHGFANEACVSQISHAINLPRAGVSSHSGLMNRVAKSLVVRALRASSPIARLHLGHRVFFCLIGKSGVTARKREGDGASPRGSFRMLKLLERQDRGLPHACRLKRAQIKPDDGWCDGAGDRNYNRPVKLPYPGSHEKLARQDSAYDAVVILDYNLHPKKRGAGSAIFFHLIREGATHTEGCVAVSARDMRLILAACGPKTRMIIV